MSDQGKPEENNTQKEKKPKNVKDEIYQYDGRLANLRKDIAESTVISERNRQVLHEFDTYLGCQDMIKSRVIKLLYVVKILGGWLGNDFEAAERKDIEVLVSKVEQHQKFSPWTKQDYKLILRKFYQLLHGLDWKSKTFPPEVAWIRIGIKLSKRKLPSSLLTEEEVAKMIDFANGPFQRAFIAVLYETGARIGEILSMNIKDVTQSDFGAFLDLFGKTGSRRVPIVVSAPYLLEWINNHPKKADPEAALWYSKSRYNRYRYATAAKMLETVGRRAGIEKPLNPHHFRHSRATRLANKLTEQQLKFYFGWVGSSKMAERYVHLCSKDIEACYLDVYGLKPPEDKPSEQLKTRTCVKCHRDNKPTDIYCGFCGFPLDKEMADKIVQVHEKQKEKNLLLDKMLKNRDFKEIFEKSLKAMFEEEEKKETN